MPPNKLLKKLQSSHPDLSFTEGETFRWAPQEQVIYYTRKDFSPAELLHEVGHALLGHNSYNLDIDLLAMERAAWEKARTIAPDYFIAIAEEEIEDALETYRQWLFSRSLCPNCRQSGLQTKTGTYQCVNCRCQWSANQAKNCMLRRKVLRS